MWNEIERTDIICDIKLSLPSFLQPFNESVNICHTPIVRKCGDEPVGPDICSTHYETNCETKYKTYEVEQDEPECRMELMTKCKDVTSKISYDNNCFCTFRIAIFLNIVKIILRIETLFLTY